jgi:predicted DNA-binding transcriptional regulator AlpA
MAPDVLSSREALIMAQHKRDQEQPERLISKAELLRLIPLNYVTIWSMIRAGTFPRAVVLNGGKNGRGRIAWRAKDINNWMATLPSRRLRDDEDGVAMPGAEKPRKRGKRERLKA